MADPRLPVIYAHFAPDWTPRATAYEPPEQPQRCNCHVIAYPPPPESPPREYWRLLEEGEEICVGDLRWTIESIDGWKVAEQEFVGTKARDRKFSRRVAPPPTCATCATCEYFDPGLHYFETVCGHHAGLTDPKATDYCSKHPQAQEANRG